MYNCRACCMQRHRRSYIHTYTHTYIHTYIHTCMHAYIVSEGLALKSFWKVAQLSTMRQKSTVRNSCTHVSMYVCMHPVYIMCVYVCMCVCMYVTMKQRGTERKSPNFHVYLCPILSQKYRIKIHICMCMFVSLEAKDE